MGIASRESKVRNIIGDGGDGYDIMQIDDRSFPECCHSGLWKNVAGIPATILARRATRPPHDRPRLFGRHAAPSMGFPEIPRIVLASQEELVVREFWLRS